MSLEIYIGPMYAGKTTKLMNLYEESTNSIVIDYILEEEKENNVIISNISNHDTKIIQDCYKTKTLQNVYNKNKYNIESYYDRFMLANTIFINECQFFPDLKQFVLNAQFSGKHIKLFGLDGDFKQDIFGQTFELIPYCNYIEKLTGKCNNCDNKSIISHRITKKQDIYVPDSNEYIPLCLSCYK